MKETNSPATGPRRRHYGYIIILCCCLIMGVDVGLLMSCAGIFYAPVSEALGVSVGSFGIYMSLSFITSSLMLSVAGRMMERYSARWILTGASALGGLVLTGMGCATALWQFYVLGAVMGMVLAFLMYLSFPMLINRWFRTRVGFFIGICSAASGIGGVVFNPIGGAIIEAWGWRAAYLVFAAMVLLIVTPLLAWLLRDRPSDMGLEPNGDPEKSGTKKAVRALPDMMFGQAVRTGKFYALLLFAFLIMAVSTFNLFIPKFTLTCGFDQIQSSYAASAIMAGVTIGKILLGHINDRNCLLGSLATCGLGALGLVVLVVESSVLWAVLLGSFLFGWSYAGVTVQTAMLTRTAFGGKDYGQIFSIISMALAAGGAIASGAWGFLAEATSYPTAFLLGAALLVVAFALAAYSLRRKQS